MLTPMSIHGKTRPEEDDNAPLQLPGIRGIRLDARAQKP
jgi:hypothetical protein